MSNLLKNKNPVYIFESFAVFPTKMFICVHMGNRERYLATLLGSLRIAHLSAGHIILTCLCCWPSRGRKTILELSDLLPSHI